MAYTPITITLDPPLVTDDPATFDTKAFQYVQDQSALAGQINTIAGETDSNAAAASASASDAQAAAASADDVEEVVLSAANFKGQWSSLTGSLSVPSSVFHDGTYWQLLNNLADVTTSEPGVSGDWAAINASTFWTPISTSQTLDARRYYAVDFTAGPLTLTLPATPQENDFIQWYKSAGESIDSVVARNGETIMGLAEDLTIDIEATALHLVYNGTDWRVVR